MRLNIRVLTFVGALVVSIAAGVVLVRPPTAAFAERVAERGAGSLETINKGILLRPGKDGISVELPSCDTSAFRDRFLLHIYLESSNGGINPNFVNRDFDLAGEPVRKMATSNGEVCIVDRPYNTAAPKMVVVGQFSMPEGRCCEVIWSRNYVFSN